MTKQPEPKKEKYTALSFFTDTFDILDMFVKCAVMILVLFTFIIRPTVVDGESMEDTLHDGELLLLTEIGYTPKQGDIVAVHNVGTVEYYAIPIVKRIIAVGGQTIDIDFTTWTVTVDGEVLDEPYRKIDTGTLTSDWTFPMTVPEGCVFCMGDNRDHSADSRCYEIGMIDERCIIGKVSVRIFPFSKVKIFD